MRLHDADQADEVLWLEQLDPRGQVVQRQRHERLPLRIGRGYDSHCLVDQAGVAPQHLVIERDAEGALLARACAAAVLHVDGAAAPVTRQRLGAVATLRLGEGGASLRVIDARRLGAEATPGRLASALAPAAPVAPAAAPKKTALADRHALRSAAATLTLVLASVALLAAGDWFEATQGSAFWRSLVERMPVVLVLGLWVLMWAMLTPLLRGELRWARHGRIAALGLLAYALLATGLPLAAAALGWAPADMVRGSLAVLLACALAAAHLRAMSLAPRTWRIGATITLATGLLLAARPVIEDLLDDTPRPRLAASLPASWPSAAPQALEPVMLRLQAMEADVAAARDEPAPRAGR